MRVRIAPDRRTGAGAPDRRQGVTVQPVGEGRARPGFTAGAGEAALVGGQWLVTLGADPESAGALAAARLAGEHRATLDARGLPPATAASVALGLCLRAWRYDRLRTVEPPPALRRLDLLTNDPDGLRAAWRPASAALAGCVLARDLVAEPSNTLTPRGFVARLAPLRKAGITIEVLKGAALRHAGLGGLLAVGGGSAHRPRLAVLRWAGRGGDPVVFVGKGVTFDTGGLNIKPAQGMEEMRADMAGAAACAGAMLALARRNSPAPAAAVLALAENMTDARGYRPSDVLRMGCGTTVEVVDTDAEGRLVLADALGWARRHLRPVALIDLATLTGSIAVALGGEMAGLFCNDDALAAGVLAAGQAVHEPVWRMPIGEGHRADLASDIADLRQCASGRGQPDGCHAAAFLREFVGNTPWAHLDIAGTESRAEADDRRAAGATGFGVRLLDRLVRERFER